MMQQIDDGDGDFEGELRVVNDRIALFPGRLIAKVVEVSGVAEGAIGGANQEHQCL